MRRRATVIRGQPRELAEGNPGSWPRGNIDGHVDDDDNVDDHATEIAMMLVMMMMILMMMMLMLNRR
jgi:hypothetical protein